MGPPLISGGNYFAGCGVVWSFQASMGPPLISGGNLNDTGNHETPVSSFNGAAADQRRKRETYDDWRKRMAASMGPPLISGGNLEID